MNTFILCFFGVLVCAHATNGDALAVLAGLIGAVLGYAFGGFGWAFAGFLFAAGCVRARAAQ